MTTVTPIDRLTDAQVTTYRERGYLVLPNFLTPDELDFEERARAVTASNDVYDLDPAHSPQSPRVRRIKSPNRQHEVYHALVSHPRVMSVLSSLITPDIRLYGTKLNLKQARHGDAIEWHQDWAYYPHTNDDVLNVGFLLDDVTEDNGPLLVVPGSNRGPVYDHHSNGVFTGAVEPRPELRLETAEALTGPAGSITIHHVRALHASGPNRSPSPRRLLLHIYAAADAWPLVGCGAPGGDRRCPGADYAAYDARIVHGRPTRTPRMETLPVNLPLPGPGDNSSIFTTQGESAHRYFH